MPRLELEKPEWERTNDEKWKRAAEAKLREEALEEQRISLGEGQAVRDESMMTKLWRLR